MDSITATLDQEAPPQKPPKKLRAQSDPPQLFLNLNDLDVVVSGDAVDGEWGQEDVLVAPHLLGIGDNLESQAKQHFRVERFGHHKKYMGGTRL